MEDIQCLHRSYVFLELLATGDGNTIMRKILIVGATSAIAQHVARIWASGDADFFLVGRDKQRLAAVADDLRVRGSKLVETYELDVTDLLAHGTMIQMAVDALGRLDVAFIAHGSLPDQKQCEGSFDKTLEALQTNCLSVISLLTHLERNTAEFLPVTRVSAVVVASLTGQAEGTPPQTLQREFALVNPNSIVSFSVRESGGPAS